MLNDHKVLQGGQLFIIDGDLNQIRCDALLIPTDIGFGFTRLWGRSLREGCVSRVKDLVKHNWFVVKDPLEVEGSHQLWFGNVGNRSFDHGEYVRVAEEFVRQAADSLHRTVKHPVLALNILGTGAGGKRDDKGQLLQLLVNKLTDAAVEHSVDVVLVCWGRKQYSAARRAEQRNPSLVSTSSVLNRPDVKSKVLELAEHSLRNRLVHFVGAGVSSSAGLPSWQSLLDEIAKSTDLPEEILSRLYELDVRDQAKILVSKISSTKYFESLNRMLSQQHYSLLHGLIASLHPSEIVTTNYDHLLEMAVGTEDQPSVLPGNAVSENGRWILKLHGTLDNPDSIVLTRDDYLNLPQNSGALFGIVQAMLMTKHMLFTGYSLTDDSFHRVIHEVRRARPGHSGSKIGTVFTLFEDSLLTELWGEDLDIIHMLPTPKPEERQEAIAIASRELAIVLNQICRYSANPSEFLLDDTYESMLDDRERELKTLLLQLQNLSDNNHVISKYVQSLLSPLSREDK
jgi:hypothetical protein